MGEMMMIDQETFKEWFLDAFEPFATDIQQALIRLDEKVEANGTAIKENRAAILENRVAIETNRAAIEANRVAIDANRAAIQENRVIIEANRRGIAQNAQAIAELRADMNTRLDVITDILRKIVRRLDKLEAQGAAQQRDVADLRQRVTRLEQVVFA